MPALKPQYMSILKKVLAARFVPSLPPLLGNASAADQAAKQLSRAFSAFALYKLLDITPQAAAASVVDDFQDKGIDAIHYDAPSETLYLLQTKLKESEQFKKEDALTFCEGTRCRSSTPTRNVASRSSLSATRRSGSSLPRASSRFTTSWALSSRSTSPTSWQKRIRRSSWWKPRPELTSIVRKSGLRLLPLRGGASTLRITR
jgi:hypothetical protein